LRKILNFYIHVPVCNTICDYCDFFSVDEKKIDSDFWNRYYHAILEDLDEKMKLVKSEHFLYSVFFGGGTPSLAPVDFIANVVFEIKSKITGKIKNPEISLEANPESLTEEKVQSYYDSGINRISIGAQSLNPDLLRYLGRSHDFNHVEKALKILQQSKIKNYNIDIIYGIPGQTVEDLRAIMDLAIKYDVKHISAYGLSVEKGTPLYRQVENRSKKSLCEEEYLEQMEFIKSYLKTKEYTQYEISNFSKSGKYCRHNYSIWKYRDYLGLGVSASSFISKKRVANHCNLKRYMRTASKGVEEETSPFIDYMIGSFRILTFQKYRPLYKLISSAQKGALLKLFAKFAENEWIYYNDKGFQITPKGINFSDSMLESVAVMEIQDNQKSRKK